MAEDAWRRKPADQWSQEDARDILTDSPWAKKVKVRYVERGNRSHFPTPSPLPGPGTPPIGIPGGGGPADTGPGGVATLSEILVRWQSASIVQSAFRLIGGGDLPASELAEENYLIAAEGIPDLGSNQQDWESEQIRDRLRDGARLFVGNKRSVLPTGVHAELKDNGWTVVYIFPRSEIGQIAGEKVKLLGRVGAAQFTAEFKTKEMKFNGKLDL